MEGVELVVSLRMAFREVAGGSLLLCSEPGRNPRIVSAEHQAGNTLPTQSSCCRPMA